MTRHSFNWASRALGMSGSTSACIRRHRTSPLLESLEQRLSLSTASGLTVVPADLNPQPLPPGYVDGRVYEW